MVAPVLLRTTMPLPPISIQPADRATYPKPVRQDVYA
jgi:hypothetical protein